jgi:arylsulfatase A-like enzyme
MKALALLITLLAPLSAAPEKPNFIVINIDDLGYADIGPYGSNNRTPNLDRMAKEGRKLTSHYAAPLCTPSRTALLTGCYPKRALPIPHVLFPNAALGLHPDEVTLAEVLKDAGYATACIGKWHLGDQAAFLPTKQGFDSFYGIPYSNDMGPAADGSKSNPGKPLPVPPKSAPHPADDSGLRGHGQPPLPLMENDKVIGRVKAEGQFAITRDCTDRAVKFLRDTKDRPFFLYLPHIAVHFPLYPSDKFRGKSPNGLLGDWAEEVDWSVGQVLDALRELGLAEKTLVIFTSDNGGSLPHGSNNTPLRGSKGQTLEGGIRVPTLAWWPGKIPAGTSSEAITSNMDVLPTFARLAGAKVPSDRKIDGVDLWPALAGDTSAKPPRDHFFYFRGLELDAVRSGPWKLHLAKDKQAPQLYHLGNDIGESKDLAKEQPEEVRRLQEFAATMKDDLGLQGKGPGCRPPGRAENPKPLMSPDGSVRADATGEVKRFP